MEDKISALKATQDTQADNQLIQLQLINNLRKDKKPQPLQKDRGEIHARQKMRLKPWAFSRLLASMKDDIEIRPYHLRENQNVLVLK